MKKKFTALIAFAAFLICALTGFALAEEPEDTLVTDVKIKFKEAVYFVEMGIDGMDVDYSQRTIPPRGVDAYFHSDNVHTLRVCDRRSVPGNWSVYAGISPMTSGSESFIAHLFIPAPTATSGLIPNLVGPETNRYIYIREGPVKIMGTEADLTEGNFDLTATNKVGMRIALAEVEKILPLSYSTTVTWTLTLTP